MKLLFATGFICFFLVITTLGQKGVVSAESGGENTAVSLPLPQYPEAARKAGLHGSVSVVVTIDGQGNVKAAEASRFYPYCPSVTLRPELLEMQNLALNNAKKAKFKPSDYYSTRTDVVRYFFVLPDDENPKGNTKTGKGGLALVDKAPITNTDKKESASPSTVSGGVLNGKAISLPRPSYPAAARAIKAGGPVVIQVTILEDGTVYTAEALSGHPLLRSNSEIAACNARFTPTLLLGKPVKVSGNITYNYVP